MVKPLRDAGAQGIRRPRIRIDGRGEDPDAVEYLEHLLNEGRDEGDCGSPMEMPPWYDAELFKQGQSYMDKYRFVLQSGMLAGLVAVLAIPSILNVLICTRQSSTEVSAYRRYVRTMLHVSAWYENSPEDPNSKFWISLRAVRSAHSTSSRACARLGAGRITQKDLALTQFGFIGFLTLGLHRIQMYDEGFLEGTTHMWRVLGYLLGIKDEYNLCRGNWAETKPLLSIVMRKVYEPALEKTSADFDRMCSALLQGLWYINTSLTVKSFLFLTKRLACVRGYEYYDFDHQNDRAWDPQQHRAYKDLGWWDRFLVYYGLFLVTFWHKYKIVRWYLNLRVKINEWFMKHMPYLAILRFGPKDGVVSIFKRNGQAQPFEYHM